MAKSNAIKARHRDIGILRFARLALDQIGKSAGTQASSFVSPNILKLSLCAASFPRYDGASEIRCFPTPRAKVLLRVFSLEVRQSAPGHHVVAVQDFIGFDLDGRPDPLIDRTKILIAIVEQLFEALDHEIGLLKIVD
jgi:hypothetical protein